jgi:hypothetical protein
MGFAAKELQTRRLTASPGFQSTIGCPLLSEEYISEKT